MPGTRRPPARVRSELFRIYQRLSRDALSADTAPTPTDEDVGLKEKTGRVL